MLKSHALASRSHALAWENSRFGEQVLCGLPHSVVQKAWHLLQEGC